MRRVSVVVETNLPPTASLRIRLLDPAFLQACVSHHDIGVDSGDDTDKIELERGRDLTQPQPGKVQDIYAEYTGIVTLPDSTADVAFRLERFNRNRRVPRWKPIDAPADVITEADVQQGGIRRKWDYVAAARNKTPGITWLELLKIIIMTILMIPLIRIVLATVAVLFGVVYLRFISFFQCTPFKRGEGVPKIFRVLIWPVHIVCRFALTCFGFYWIHEVVDIPGLTLLQRRAVLSGVGTPKIIVCNHIGWVENLYWASRLLFSFVAKHDVVRIPCVGAGLKLFDPILVDRKDSDSRKSALDAIQERAKSSDSNVSTIVIYPTGTTSNQQSIPLFRRGAFAPGQRVLPVLIRYPYNHVDLTWETNMLRDTYRALCCFYNSMEVVYLPPVTPTEEEVADPELFARNVRRTMILAAQRRVAEFHPSSLDVEDIMEYYKY